MRRVRSSLERTDFGVEKIQSSAFSKEPMVGRAWEATLAQGKEKPLTHGIPEISRVGGR
jgi:hypothetical protein